jgi:hypothetical protein
VAEIITVTDLPVEIQTAELVDAMVAGANAKASRVAPCLASTDPAPTADQLAEAKLVLIGAVKRWAGTGAGGVQQIAAGPFSQMFDTRQRTGYNLWPSEIGDLQDICKGDDEAKAFSVDTAPFAGTVHLGWCSLEMGATYCSCGADIAGYPIYELG